MLKLVLDALWRALLYCLHPKVILLSLVPLALLLALAGAATYWGWSPAVEAVRVWLEGQALLSTAVQWLTFMGAGGLKSAIAPLIVVFLSVPILVMLCLLAVSLCMTPAITALVATRRFPELLKKRGSALWLQALWGLSSTAMALVVFVVTLPLWLVPLVALLLPPFIWGWLTARILSFDVLAEHASVEERQAIAKAHRMPLLMMGLVAGYLGTVPGVLGLTSVLTIALAPILMPIALWLYTLVFAFSSAWFAHYCLAALQALRESQRPPAPPAEPIEPVLLQAPHVN